MERGIYNFAAEPAALPPSILKWAKAQLVLGGLPWLRDENHGDSHRGKECKSGLRALLVVPDTHSVLFLQDGATTQFTAVPLNLCDGPFRPYRIHKAFKASASPEDGGLSFGSFFPFRSGDICSRTFSTCQIRKAFRASASPEDGLTLLWFFFPFRSRDFVRSFLHLYFYACVYVNRVQQHAVAV